jgi:hypothetical protein
MDIRAAGVESQMSPDPCASGIPEPPAVHAFAKASARKRTLDLQTFDLLTPKAA